MGSSPDGCRGLPFYPIRAENRSQQGWDGSLFAAALAIGEPLAGGQGDEVVVVPQERVTPGQVAPSVGQAKILDLVGSPVACRHDVIELGRSVVVLGSVGVHLDAANLADAVVPFNHGGKVLPVTGRAPRRIGEEARRVVAPLSVHVASAARAVLSGELIALSPGFDFGLVGEMDQKSDPEVRATLPAPTEACAVVHDSAHVRAVAALLTALELDAATVAFDEHTLEATQGGGPVKREPGDSLGTRRVTRGAQMTESRAYSEEPVDTAGIEASADVRGDYRYTLTRTWNSSAEPLVFILLNPSTADASQDDPTIRRCIGFAKRWGFGGIVVVNLYAYRATKPRDMLAADDPVGPDNDRIITEIVNGKTVVAAWGTNARRERVAEVLALIQGTARLLALEITKFGHPRHPLYVHGEAQPVPWPAPLFAPPS